MINHSLTFIRILYTIYRFSKLIKKCPYEVFYIKIGRKRIIFSDFREKYFYERERKREREKEKISKEYLFGYLNLDI